MSLLIGDNFEAFKEFSIQTEEIISTYSAPNKVQRLDQKVRLYLKSFNNEDEKRRLLLLGTDINNTGKEYLVFVFWIPEKYKYLNDDLLSLLEVFANEFGFKIRVGNQESYFFRSIEKMITGELEDIRKVINVLPNDMIPHNLLFMAKQELLGAINKVSIYYAFAINHGKYTFWVNSYPFVTKNVKSGWFSFVNENLLNVLQSNGQTKIEVYKQKRTDYLEEDTETKFSEIQIPKIYEKQFDYILNQINTLKRNEKILFRGTTNIPSCIFCGSTEITKEHIFPKWLRPFINETIMEGSVNWGVEGETLLDVYNSATTLGKKESSQGYTAKVVCEECNNTWMSRLEHKVKQILIKNNTLVNKVPKNLPDSDIKDLSMWVVLKALLLENKVAPGLRSIDYDAYEYLRNGQIHPNFLVEIAIVEAARVNYAIHKGITKDTPIELKKFSFRRAKELMSKFLSVSFQIGHLIFRVSFMNYGIPFTRVTIIKRTQTLFPINDPAEHKEIPNANEIWKNVVEKGIEFVFFSSHGMLLIER